MGLFGFKEDNQNCFPLGHLAADRKTFAFVFAVFLVFGGTLFCVFVLDYLLTTMGQISLSVSLSPFSVILNHFRDFKD